MIKTKKATMVVDTIAEVHCNICGKSCKVDVYSSGLEPSFEYATLSFEGGYGAGDLDLVREESHFCLDCYKDIRHNILMCPPSEKY